MAHASNSSPFAFRSSEMDEMDEEERRAADMVAERALVRLSTDAEIHASTRVQAGTLTFF